MQHSPVSAFKDVPRGAAGRWFRPLAPSKKFPDVLPKNLLFFVGDKAIGAIEEKVASGDDSDDECVSYEDVLAVAREFYPDLLPEELWLFSFEPADGGPLRIAIGSQEEIVSDTAAAV